jgi:2-iminobutanoate/2-iminopropanoate deaminase
MTTRKVILTPKAPKASATHSQGIKVENTLYVCGQLGLIPATHKLVSGGAEKETHQIMENIKAILEAGGFSIDDIVQLQIFLVDFNDFSDVIKAYGTYFSGLPPVRTTVQVAYLAHDAKVEITATAVYT